MKCLQLNARKILRFIAKDGGMQGFDEILLNNVPSEILMIPVALFFLVLAVTAPDFIVDDLVGFRRDALLLCRNHKWVKVVVRFQINFRTVPFDISAYDVPRDIGITEFPRRWFSPERGFPPLLEPAIVDKLLWRKPIIVR